MFRDNGPCQLCFEVLVKQIPVFLHARTQASKNLEESISVAISKPNKQLGDPKSYIIYLFTLCSLKILERLIYACIEPTMTHYYLESKLDFGVKG